MVTIKKNHWYSLRRQSLAAYARIAGFDLSVFSDYSPKVRAELRKKTIREAMLMIKWTLSEQGFDLSAAKKGVYAISLSSPLSIQYPKRHCQVLYVGRGNIETRLKSHFEHKLFDLMLSLSGADFDFDFAVPARAGTALYFHEVEYQMLKWFDTNYGEPTKICRPLLNKINGHQKNFTPDTGWWKKPLKTAGVKPLWELAPTKFNNFKLV